MNKTLLPIILILGGTGIIQWHSIAFWSDNVDQQIGWAWSIMIEAAGLWLWYRPDIPSRTLGLLASLLLLAGPLYQIATPALDSHAQAKAIEAARVQSVQAVHAQLALDAQLMHTYAQNSQKRTGWLPAIQGLQQRMDAARKKLATMTANKTETVAGQGFTVYALVILQALGLILIQISNVLAITHISGRARGMHTYAQPCTVDAHIEAEAEEQEPDRAPCADEYAQLRKLAAQVRDWIDREGMSVAAAATRLGVDRPNLSYLLRWEKPGDRKPADAVLGRLWEVMA